MNFDVEFRIDDDFPIAMEENQLLNVRFDGIAIPIGQDYNDLRNKPTLNGRTIQGDVQEADPTVPDWAKAPVKPEYSAAEVGAIPADAILGAADLEYMWDTTEI